MRNIVVSQFLSLDGVMEAPHEWSFPFGSDEQNEFKFKELKAADALLLGRVTYDAFAESWPKMAEETGEFGVMMNGYAKYVVSTTLTELPWNNSTQIKDNVVEEVCRLKDQPGKDILVYGSGQLCQTLMKHELVDEYRLMVYPIVLGRGQRFFVDGQGEKTLKLVDLQTTPTGVSTLTYHPDRSRA